MNKPLKDQLMAYGEKNAEGLTLTAKRSQLKGYVSSIQSMMSARGYKSYFNSVCTGIGSARGVRLFIEDGTLPQGGEANVDEWISRAKDKLDCLKRGENPDTIRIKANYRHSKDAGKRDYSIEELCQMLLNKLVDEKVAKAIALGMADDDVRKRVEFAKVILTFNPDLEV